jgi:signal transduction histidine kinase
MPGRKILSPELRRRPTRFFLLAAFGGLLLLMAVAGFDSIEVLREIQTRNDAIRREFLHRNRLLNQIRSDLYLSGTYVRDYVLEPASEDAESHRRSLSRTRRDMNAALDAYARLIAPSLAGPFNNLRQEIDEYWRLLEPALNWNVAERHARGYHFLSDEVFPRRTAMLDIADQIAAVNEQQLNAGDSQVAELFARFRIRLGLTLAGTLLLGLLLAGYSMKRILTLEAETSERFREIAHAREELKELSARLVSAQESERRAISRELHDQVGQSLSALLVTLGNLAAAVPPELAPALNPQIGAIRKLAEGTVADVRNMALLLRPSMLDDLGLVPALQWQAREVAKRTGLRVHVAATGLAEDLPDEHKTSIYRIVQEALHNCSRHAEATTVRIVVRREADSLLLTVQDDGKGFNPQLERGLGLVGMEERVAHLGGALRIDSHPGRGTLLSVELPLPHPAPALSHSE